MNVADLTVPAGLRDKMRRDWGLQNMIGVDAPIRPIPVSMKNAHQQRQVRAKIARFVQTAIYPQQLTIPRQYATTQVGVSLYKVLEGRNVAGIEEQGVRVIVQENARQSRFVVSPLFNSKHDALAWARRNMGLD